jgi:hypothetical protein
MWVQIHATTKTKMTFEQYLSEMFVGFNEIGGVPITKDNFETMFNAWLQSLDIDKWLELGQEYGEERSYDWY